MGKGSESPKGEEATVELLPLREHRPREGCLPQWGWREKKKGEYGCKRRNKTTPEEIGHLSNLLMADPGRGRSRGLLNPSQRATNVEPPVVDNS